MGERRPARAARAAMELRASIPATGDRPLSLDVEAVAAIGALVADGSRELSCAVEVKQEIFQFQFDNDRVRF